MEIKCGVQKKSVDRMESYVFTAGYLNSKPAVASLMFKVVGSL